MVLILSFTSVIDILITTAHLHVQADPYLVISEDLHIYLKPQADLREYGSVTDNELAQSYLSDLRNKVYEADNVIMDILAQNLSVITEVTCFWLKQIQIFVYICYLTLESSFLLVQLDKSELAKLLFEGFTPDDPFLYGPQSMLDFRKNQSVTHSKESLSFDGVLLFFFKSSVLQIFQMT